MRKNMVSLLVAIGLAVCIAGCKHGIDEDLTNYKKPIISRINPEGIIYNNIGFVLRVFSDYYENDDYVLYLNKQKIGTASPNYWRYALQWEIPPDFLRRIINSAGSNDITIEVRITPIQTDISDDFAEYTEYISDVKFIEIKRNNTNFTSPVNLFELWSNSTDPVLQSDSTGNLCLAWREKIGDIFQAFFCFSEDEGDTWSQVLNISRSSGNVTKVDMNSDGSGNFYIVWSEEKENSHDVYFSRSLDYGATWWNPRKMNEENEDSINPDIEVDSTGKIYLTRTNFFPDDSPHYNKIRISFSSDQGDNWESKILVENEFIGGEPTMKSGENGTIYLICGADEGIYCFFSTDFGSSWQVNQAANIAGYFWWGQYSSLKIRGDKLFLIWNTEDSTGHVFENWIHFASGTNNGADWNDTQYIDHVCNTRGPKATISVDGADVNMLLHSGASLFLLRSTDEGETWSYPEFIPETESTTGRVPLDMVTGNTEGMASPTYYCSRNTQMKEEKSWSENKDLQYSNTGRIYMVYINVTDISSQTGSIYFIRTQ
jgi:hypothetical protein